MQIKTTTHIRNASPITLLDKHRNFLDNAANTFGVKTTQDWYQIRSADLKRLSGSAFLIEHYNGSLLRALTTCYPEVDWKPWLFKQVPKGWWDQQGNLSQYTDWLEHKLAITQPTDWYRVTVSDIVKLRGSGMLTSKFHGSLTKFLHQTRPQYNLKPWLFHQVPSHYWDDPANVRSFINWLFDILKLSKWTDWYNISLSTVKSKGGAGLLDRYSNSMYKLLKDAYPEHEWQVWMFANQPKSTALLPDTPPEHTTDQTPFTSSSNEYIYKFVRQFREERGIKHPEDWYHVTKSDIDAHGGSKILEKFGSSVFRLASFLHPDVKWKPWLFMERVPPGYWASLDNQRKFLEWLAKEMDVQDVQDWDRVTIEDMLERRAAGVLKRHNNSPIQLFTTVYPQVDWRPIFGRSMYLYKNKAQRTLLQRVKYLFPNDDVLFNHKSSDITFAKSGRAMELDVYVPSKNLALEYQGEHHYEAVHYSEQPLSVYQLRDSEKRAAVKAAGITLIEVPYWWDKTAASLAATITRIRPEINFQHVFEPNQALTAIPEEVVSPRTSHVNLLLAQTWNEKILPDPTGWWMSEKYDGIRAYWDGSKFISRNFLPLEIPQEFIYKMPPFALDGEFWFGYSTLQESMKVVLKSKKVSWENFKYMIFDCPLQPGTFEQRMEWLNRVIPTTQVPFLMAIPITKCTGSQHLQEYLDDILSRGGEGVMLRQPESLYISGRSGSLLKVKPYKDDEAVVISAESELLYGVTCKLPNGIVFPAVFQSGVEMELEVGAVVQFEHSGYFMNGRPRRPRIMRLRQDMTKDQLLVNTYRYTVTKHFHDSSCFACNKPLPLGALKISTTLMETNEDKPGITTSKAIDLCPEIDCVHKANLGPQVPPFKGTVVVTSSAQKLLEKHELKHIKDLPGVTVVATNSFFGNK